MGLRILQSILPGTACKRAKRKSLHLLSSLWYSSTWVLFHYALPLQLSTGLYHAGSCRAKCFFCRSCCIHNSLLQAHRTGHNLHKQRQAIVRQQTNISVMTFNKKNAKCRVTAQCRDHLMWILHMPFACSKHCLKWTYPCSLVITKDSLQKLPINVLRNAAHLLHPAGYSGRKYFCILQ